MPNGARFRAENPAFALPSLNALRAFEAAARHLSFTRAARELCVTQTAISHQVQKLEDELGVSLFHRAPRRITLTAEGRAWAAELAEIFSRLEAVNQRLRERTRSERPTVSVSVIPSFGSRWLVPRLGKFLDGHPDVDIRISSSEALVDFSIEPFDLGIRYGFGRYPGCAVEKLADDAWVVVCAPALLERARLRTPRDLEHQTLLYDDDRGDWTRWFAQQGLPPPERARYTGLSDSSMIIESALRSQGVALARWSLAADELALGRLSLPFPKVAPLSTGKAYYIAGARENLRRSVVHAFREWLRKEARTLKRGVLALGA
jgi:LysR family glycine cleavage system transcriptional activator